MFTFTATRPRRFARLRLLIVGCGDVGTRVVRRLAGRVRVLALVRDGASAAALRTLGVVPLAGDLDRPATLQRLAGLADAVLHLAPPPAEGAADPRTRALLAALARRSAPPRLVYASTTGVYGDAGGARIDETRRLAPATARARRRADAERRVRWWGRAVGARASVLRIPGIYAFDRAGGDPRERVRRGAPALAAADDVYTNHVHADDLARACIAALFRGAPQRVYHASDDDDATMGDWLDRVADLAGLPRPPRLSRTEAGATLPPLAYSFLCESRRLDNRRMRRELRVAPRVSRVEDAFRSPARGAAPSSGRPPAP